jgi:hypothetical protein
MATLTVQSVTLAGLNPSYSAASAGGDDFVNDGRTFLHVKNGGAGAITVTVTTPAQISGIDVADIAVSVPNGSERMIGPFPTNLFNASTGKASITYSGVTSVTIAAIKVS